MTDPLDVLRTPSLPVAPDRDFATRLRGRLSRALALPRGVAMSTSTARSTTAAAHRQGDVGYAWLSVPDVERAEAFYGAVLGWSFEPGSDPQGRQVAGRLPHLGLHGGEQHPTLHCCYAVADIDAAVARVREAGGRASDPVDTPHGLSSDCTDDDGTVFALYEPPQGIGTGDALAGGPGDLVYTTFEVLDSARTRAFYGAVLGWEFTAGGVEDGWQIAGGAGGLQGGHARATTLPMWQVADNAAAVAAVRAAGGTAGEPQTRPYGIETECTDDQGSRFYLGQF